MDLAQSETYSYELCWLSQFILKINSEQVEWICILRNDFNLIFFKFQNEFIAANFTEHKNGLKLFGKAIKESQKHHWNPSNTQEKGIKTGNDECTLYKASLGSITRAEESMDM